MKTKVRLLIGLIASHCVVDLQAQGTFQNLGFESALPVAIPGDPGVVEFSSAFPGWLAYVGGVQQTFALSNRSYLDSSGIAIVDSNWPGYLGPNSGVIAGNFSALLQAGLSLSVNPVPADTMLSQIGLVPVDAQTLRFRAYSASESGFLPLRLAVGGQNLTFVPLVTDPKFTLFGADIRPWQGLSATIDFTLLAQRPHFINNYMFLDSINFSNVPIPEPSVIGLFNLGALFLGWRLRCRRG